MREELEEQFKIREFLDRLIELYVEYCVFVSGTKECEANSIGDFIGWLMRKKIK